MFFYVICEISRLNGYIYNIVKKILSFRVFRYSDIKLFLCLFFEV